MRGTYLPKLLTVCGRDRSGGRDARCGHDLTTSTRVTAAPADLIAFIDQTSPLLDPAVDDEHAHTFVDQLIDTIIITSRIAADEDACGDDRLNVGLVLAIALADSHRALSDPSGPRMHAITTSSGRAAGALPVVWDGVSPRLAAVLIKHRRAMVPIKHRNRCLQALEQLRERSVRDGPEERVDPAVRMRAVPPALWPDWAIRLRPARMRINPDRFRIEAAIFLCLPGTTMPLRTIRDPWPGQAKNKRVEKFFTQLTADPHGSAILGALCALADTLDRDGSPIDYTHRRELAARIELLDAHTWTVICRTTGTLVGAGAKLAHARLWLWETLTEGVPDQAPPRSARTPPHSSISTPASNACSPHPPPDG
jgi:hypothetical protein